MSYAQIIYKLLQTNRNKAFKSYELIKTKTPYGWLGISGDRVARKLAEKGEIHRKSRGVDGYAEYWLGTLKQ